MKSKYRANSRRKDPLKPILITFIVIVSVIFALTLVAGAEGSFGDWFRNLIGKGNSNPYANAEHPIATLTMENGDVIEIELYCDVAPNTVANFVTLANSGYYDGLTFHRVISGFMIQGGCPLGTGTGNPGYSIKGEFSKNGFENNLQHTRGVISMARSSAMDSAGSQFFIMHADAPHLDGSYAAFGKVISGMEAVDKIASVATNYSDKPLTAQVIKSITVDTKGVEYTVNKIGG